MVHFQQILSLRTVDSKPLGSILFRFDRSSPIGVLEAPFIQRSILRIGYRCLKYFHSQILWRFCGEMMENRGKNRSIWRGKVDLSYYLRTWDALILLAEEVRFELTEGY